MSKENLNKKFEKEFNKLSEKDKREVNNLIRFMHEKKYHDSQYEELLKSLDEKILDEKFEKLERNIRNYCGDYGTLESRLEETLWLILDILKDLRGSDKE